MSQLKLLYRNDQGEMHSELIDFTSIYELVLDSTSGDNALVGVSVEGVTAQDGSGISLRFGEDQIQSVTSRPGETFAEIAVRLPAILQPADDKHWGDDRNFLLRLMVEDHGVSGFRMTASENSWLIFRDSDKEIAASKNDFGRLDESNNQNRKGDRMVRSRKFPFEKLFFVDNLNYKKSHESDRVAVGVHETSDGSLFLVTAHSRDTVKNGYRLKSNIFAAPPEHHYKLKRKFPGSQPDRLIYLINIIQIGAGSRAWVHVWNGDSKTGLQDFIQPYNQSIRDSREGLWQARNDMPWVVNPLVDIDDCSALYIYRQDASDTHENWVDILLTDDSASSRKPARLRYDWKFAPPESDDVSVNVDAFIECDLLPKHSGDDTEWPLPRPIPDEPGILHRLLNKSAGLYEVKSNTSVDAKIKLGMYSRNFDGIESFLPFGSLDIDFGKERAADDEARELGGSCMLRLRSDSNPCRSGAFASSSTRDMRVKVQFAGGGDVDERYASFDLSEVLEDQLHRPTETMVHFRDPHSRGGIEADLGIRTENRFGSQETAELTLSHVENELSIDKFSVFQARPFFYAAISDIDLDPEGGSILARWRNDDDREWRMPYRSTTLEMPAQSIGEEMERGSRFWSNKDGNGDEIQQFQPYIDPEKPIDYRFSPTTRLTIEPDNGRRRYNSVPSNLFRITREAGVKGFQTEMVYPVAIGYERGDRPSVQVMLSEAGVFMGETGPNLPFSRPGDENAVDIVQ